MATAERSGKVQGEGDYAADRRYTDAAQAFAESGKVDGAARKAAPTSQAEQQEMEDAERTGKAHSKGEDPAPGDPSLHTPSTKTAS